VLRTKLSFQQHDLREITSVILRHSTECEAICARNTSKTKPGSISAPKNTLGKRHSPTIKATPPAKRLCFSAKVAIIPPALVESDSDPDIEYLGPVKREALQQPPEASSSSSTTRQMPIKQENMSGDILLQQETAKTINFLSELPPKVAQAFRDKGVTDKASFKRLNLQKKHIMTVLREYQKEYGFSEMEMTAAKCVLEEALGEI